MIDKRQRFVITSVLLSLGFVAVSLLDNQFRFGSIAVLSVLTLILFAWSIFEGLGRNMTLLTLVLPFAFTVGVGLFWFLLPATIWARIPAVLFYGIGVYALCSTANVYTVAAVRNIALLRSARGVGFVLTLVTSFLLYDTILSLRATPLVSAPLVALVTLLLAMQGLWAIPLSKDFNREVSTLALVSALVLAQTVVVLYFWPVTVVVGSLFLTATLYLLLGLGQARLEARLFPQIVREYLVVGAFVLLGMFLATSWAG